MNMILPPSIESAHLRVPRDPPCVPIQCPRKPFMNI